MGVTSDVENPAVEKINSGRTVSLWYKIVTISLFMVAMAIDPLFFYIPIIDQYNKCLRMDKKLWKISLIFRSLTDINALMDLLYQHRLRSKSFREESSQVFRRRLVQVVAPLAIEVLTLLPIPQLLIGVVFYKIWRSGSFQQRVTSINYCLLAQYLLRMYRLYKLHKIKEFDIKLKVKAMVYFLLYIFTSHVFGALWYFLSIQREISCWYSACVNYSTDHKRCMDTFDCDYRTIASRNITFLNEHCSTDISEGASSVPFNFGIYLDALKTGTVDDVNFLTKLLYCFWWGLRNISNFGTNLVTSTYLCENAFATFISMISFLLLTFVAATATATAGPKAPVSAQQRRRKFLMEKLKSWNISGDENLKSWNISGDDLPSDLKKKILSSIDKNVEENEDADLKNDIFSVLPAETRKRLCMEILRTVPVLGMMDKQALEKMYDYLKPVTYKENSFIFRMGDPLDCMLFIITGTVWTYSRTSSTSATSSKMAARLLGKGQFYGKELLNSADFTQLPISTEHVKTRGKVQAFALMADDLANVVAVFNLDWVINNYANNNSGKVEDDIVEIN